MYYGDDIVVSKRGLRINPKALRPVGIADKSICWGIQVPPPPGRVDKKPDLVISAFPPVNWHILFRVIIELRDKRGTLAKVTEFLSDVLKFNILSTQCAPAGHNHASMHMIGAALSMKDDIDAKLRGIVEDFNPEVGAFHDDNYNFRDRLGKEVSLYLFEYSRQIEEEVEKKNALERKINRDFLHPKFGTSNTLLHTESLKEIYELKNQDKQSNIERFNNEIIISVKSRWLQHMAVFRIYSQAKQNQKNNQSANETLQATWDAPISFEYNRAESLLKPRPDDEDKYLEIINDLPKSDGFPVMAIAAFTSNEHYVRIVFPDKRKRIFIDINYNVKIKENNKSQAPGEFENTSSIGLLKEIAKNLEEKDINLNYVENSVTNYTRRNETGKIHLIGTPEGDKFEEIILDTKSALAQIAKKRKATFETNIGMVGAKRIFISTKFALFSRRIELKDMLTEAIKEQGFEPVFGDPLLTSDSSDKEGNQALEGTITPRIMSSDAFLQIVPKEAMKGEIDWLLFELGAARGLSIPCALCVDEPIFKKYPKVGKDWMKYSFKSDEDTKIMVKQICEALINLAERVYDRK